MCESQSVSRSACVCVRVSQSVGQRVCESRSVSRVCESRSVSRVCESQSVGRVCV